MANTLVEMFRMKDIRKKILFTLGILAVTRVGAALPIPGINPGAVLSYFEEFSNSFTDYLNFFSGGAFANFSIFMLGVMPYISTQIIMQLLMLVIPSLKKLAQDPQGSKKIQQYTRYGTVLVCVIQSLAASVYARSIPGAILIGNASFTIVSIISVTAGSMLMVWLGEKITQFGVGNGISLLIFAGIVARIPSAVYTMVVEIRNGMMNPVGLILVVIMFFFVIALVVYEEKGQRKIPVQYSRRVVGRKMYGSQSSYLPFKINPSGVIPVIFASSLMQTPIVIAGFLGKGNGTGIGSQILAGMNSSNWCNPDRPIYSIGLLVYIVLTIFFAYFYTSITFNPLEIANNMKKSGGFIPGIRPGKPTVEYLQKILNYIIFIGACGLVIVQVIPYFFNGVFGAQVSFGGTSIIIIVGVVLDTIKKIESQMLVRNYTGFLNNKGSNMSNSFLGY